MKLTKECIIEELKDSTQNASGMFEISEGTICKLMALYTAPPAPVVPEEAEMPSGPGVPEYNVGWANGWNSCREEVLQGAAGNSPAIPDGWKLVPVDMTPEQMRAVQINSELGAYAAANLSGAYSLFREFWDVAVAAAPKQGGQK